MVTQPNEPTDPLERSVEAWQESEEYYRTLFTLAPDVIYSVSAEDGVFTALSPEFENITGWSVDEWLGRSFAGIIHPDDLPTAVEKFQAGLRGESPPPYELRIRSKSGAYLVGEFRTKPKIQDGKVVGKIGIARDVTERKRAENALRFLAEASSLLASSLDYQTTLVNVARLAVLQIADWCIVDIVEESGSLHQLAVAHVDPSKEEMARELRRRYPPDERSARGVREAIRTGQSMLVPEISDAQLAATARDPEHLAILRDLGFRSAMIVPLVARGRTLGAITLVSAESEHRYGADDLAMAEDLARDATLAVDNARLFEDAQEALRLREEFLSIASHELKTPLTALHLHIQMLQRVIRKDSSGNEALDRTRRAVEGADRQLRRLSKLVTDLLDVSRIAAGKLELESERVDLSLLVRNVVSRFDEELAAVGSQISLRANMPVVGWWDPFRIDQVVTNLLANAIKYGCDKPIEVTVRADHASAELVVRDHGPGISAENLPHIFDRFERGAHAERQGGLGLGLYICRQLMEAHGGKIAVTSRPGEGSTFKVELPLHTPFAGGMKSS